jgi:5-methylcytosine-specific restriction endonuclease McrA
MSTPTYTNECPNCFTPFETKWETKIYCTRYCKETSRRRRAGVRKFGVDYPITHNKTCAGCQEEFTTTKATQTYCDSTCSDFYRRMRRRDTQDRLESNARKAFRHKVYIRDKGVCQLCNEYVYLNLEYPDPLSASLDHKVPVSKGGTHALYNLQLAHWICNIKRGNKDLDQ